MESEQENEHLELFDYKSIDSHEHQSFHAKNIHSTYEPIIASFYQKLSSDTSSDYEIFQQIITFEDESIYEDQDFAQIIFSIILKNNYFLLLKHFDFVLSIIESLRTYNLSLYSINDIETFIKKAYSLDQKFFIRLYNIFLKLDLRFSQFFEECCTFTELVQNSMDEDIPYILQIMSKKNEINDFQLIQSYILKIMDCNIYKLFNIELKMSILLSITQLMTWKQLEKTLHENIFNHIIDDVMEENDESYIICFCKFVTSLEKDNHRIVESIYSEINPYFYIELIKKHNQNIDVMNSLFDLIEIDNNIDGELIDNQEILMQMLSLFSNICEDVSVKTKQSITYFVRISILQMEKQNYPAIFGTKFIEFLLHMCPSSPDDVIFIIHWLFLIASLDEDEKEQLIMFFIENEGLELLQDIQRDFNDDEKAYHLVDDILMYLNRGYET